MVSLIFDINLNISTQVVVSFFQQTLIIFIICTALMGIGSAEDEVEVCPTNNHQYYAYCYCKYGSRYDKAPKNCPNVECSLNNSNSDIYPHCTCQYEKTEDYRAFYNECFRACPKGTSGDWPQCTCDDNAVYNEFTNFCVTCDYRNFIDYPRCTKFGDVLGCTSAVCLNGGKYNVDWGRCLACPTESPGAYPDCECANGLFHIYENRCYECPIDSCGVYPDCNCQNEGYVFSAYINACYIKCPNNDEGIHPQCHCHSIDGVDYYYDVNEFTCKRIVEKLCPSDSVRIGSDCVCTREDHKFYSELWQCIHEDIYVPIISLQTLPSDSCPEGGRNKWPQCALSGFSKLLITSVG